MNEPMTTERIDEITARCEKGLAGDLRTMWPSDFHNDEKEDRCGLIYQLTDGEKEFLGYANQDVPDLLAEVARLNKDRGELLANMLQSTTLSPSQVCEKYHLQNCHACERADCCDNVTPSIEKLKAANKCLHAEVARLESDSSRYETYGVLIIQLAGLFGAGHEKVKNIGDAFLYLKNIANQKEADNV